MLVSFIDAEGYVIRTQGTAEGLQVQVVLPRRRVFSCAFNLDARRILLAQGHPSGCAYSSPLTMGRMSLLSRKACDLDLTIGNHFVVGAREVARMKDRGQF